MSVAARAPARTRPAPESPYVGLVPFGEEDAGFFFGRSQEIAIAGANLRSARLTIVYGPSGVGKSSLLQAGVVHGLREAARAVDSDAPFAVCTVRSWHDDPKHRLLQASSNVLGELSGDALPAPAGTLAESLRAWTENTGTLLVVLDQFEEYFQYHDGEADGERLEGFAAELAEIVNDPTLAVHLLISIREDAWAKLDRFEGHIPLLFANYLRVDHLDVDAAREAIEGPIAAWNATLALTEAPYDVEPNLITAVLDAAAAGLALDGAEAVAAKASTGDRIEAPFIQLVLERLWRATVDDGDNVLTLARLEGLGGARKIVESHLVQALARLSREEQDVASDCFRFLVSRSKTKIAHPAADLAEWTRRPEPEVTAVLDRLTGGETGRILRAVAPPLDRPGSTSYELFHDVLAEPILAWRLAHERERSRREAQRRLVRVGGAALALVAVFAALAVWALVERGHANDLYHEQLLIRYGVEAHNAKLEHEKQDLIETNSDAAGAAAAEQATVDELTATNQRLKAQTARLTATRNGLDRTNRTLTSQNRKLSASIARLNRQNRALAARVTRLDRRYAALGNRLGVLDGEHALLSDGSGILKNETAVLKSELNAAARQAAVLKNKAAALGIHVGRTAASAPAASAPEKPRPPTRAQHFGIPAALDAADTLRAEVQRLQRRLAELLEQRARQVDAAKWFREVNAVLRRQRAALRAEIRQLRRKEAALELRHRRLEQTAASAADEHTRLSGLASDSEARTAKRQKAVAAHEKSNEQLQERNNYDVVDIGGLRNELNEERSYASMLLDRIGPPVARLTSGAQDTSQDPILAALLGTAAFHVTPYAPDDASQPAVYNALWAVLNRLDPSAARELIAPVPGKKGKVGTTTSAVLEQRVCAFVKRGFTSLEWTTWLPKGAPYAPDTRNATALSKKLARPCA